MKKNGLTIFFILITIILIFVYKDAQIILEKSKNKSFVEQFGTTTVGYENGLPVFEIDINKLRQENYKHILIASSIINGTVYNADKKKVITNLSGDYGRINTNIKSILVTGNITAKINPSNSKKSVFINSNRFHYNHLKREAKFRDNTDLVIDDIQIKSNAFLYKNKSEQIIFNAPTIISTNTSNTGFQKAQLEIKTFQLNASRNIRSDYQKKPSSEFSAQINALLKYKTTIQSKEMALNFKNNDQIIVTYNKQVIVNQKEKSLNANQLNLNFINNEYQANGGVKFKFENLIWLKDKNKKYKNNKIKSMLKKTTTIESKNAFFSKKENKLFIKNNVKIKQIDFKLACDTFIFDFNKDLIIASGNVIIEKFGIEHLNTAQLIIDIRNETFKTDSKTELSEITIEL